MAQIAGAALGVSAAAVVAFEIPGLGFREPSKPELMPVVQPTSNGRLEPQLDRERAADAAARLDLAVRRPVVAKQEEKVPDKKPEPQVSSGSVIAYIGAIYESNRTLAVVSVNGRQRIVPEGRSIEDMKLVSISDEQIVLEGQAGQRMVQRGERTGTAVSWIRNMPTSGPVAGTMNPNQNQAVVRRAGGQARGQPASASFSPEMQQRMRERGIDPSQAQRWREAARERGMAAHREGLAVNPATTTLMPEDLATRIHPDDREFGNVEIELDGETITVVDDGNEYVIRLRHMHETGEIGEDEYLERLKRLRATGAVGDDEEERR